MDTKQCKSCNQIKALSEFYIDRTHKDGSFLYRNICKECTKARATEWRKKHPESSKRKSLKYYRKIRLRALLHYSNKTLRCACCGENTLEFLSLDHIQNNGAEHRRTMKNEHTDIFHWVHKNGYPEGFQVLCMNCNFAKGIMGECPHKAMQRGEYKPLDVANYLKRTVSYHSRTHLITYNGETHSMSEWARILGVDRSVLSTRINREKWSIERAFTQPFGQSHNEILLTHNSETHTLADWARIIGIRRDTLWKRIYQGNWSIHDALTKSIRKRT